MNRTDLAIIYPMNLAEYIDIATRMAKAMCEACDLKWEDQLSYATSGSGGDNEQEYYIHLAKAALKAMVIEEPS